MTKPTLNLMDVLNVEIAVSYFLQCLDEEIEQFLSEEDKIQKESLISLKEGIHETNAKIEKFLSEVAETQFLTEEEIINLGIELDVRQKG